MALFGGRADRSAEADAWEAEIERLDRLPGKVRRADLAKLAATLARHGRERD